MFKVTERTIRNDLEEIDYFLKANGFDYLIRDNKIGIQLSESNISTKLIYKLINQKEIVTASYTKEERVLEILYALSVHEKPIKIEMLADELLVSKSTIVKDLEKIKDNLIHEDFQIHGSLEGIELIGKEAAIRSWIVKQFISTMDKQTVVDMIALMEGKQKITTYKVYWRLFENLDLRPCMHYVEVLKSSLSTQLTDRLYLQIIGNICLMKKRIAIGKLSDPIETTYTSRVSFTVSNQLYQVMNKDFQLPEIETSYLQHLLYISCCELYAYDHQDNFLDRNQYANTLIDQMAHYMEFQDRELLYQDIVKELTIMKIEDELNIPNTKNVVELHDKVFEDVYIKTKEEATWLSFQHHSVGNDDYWRLAWHFIAYRKQPYKKKKVLIISDKSRSLITILIRKLKMLFDIEIVGVSAHAQMDKYLACYDIDCIITTMHMDCAIDLVRVHPLLSEADIHVVKQHLQTHVKKVDMEQKEALVVFEITTCACEWLDIITQVEALLNTKKIVSVNVGKELYANIQNQQKDFMIHGNTLYMNVRNHEIVNRNALINVTLVKPMNFDAHEISRIEVYACTSSYTYIQYLESSLYKEGSIG